MGFFASGGLLEESDDVVGNAAEISLAVRGNDAEQALAGLLGQVGLLEDTLRRIDVWQVECCAGMTRIEDGGQPYACLQGGDHDAVHLVICDVPMLSEINWVNDFVISIRLIAVKVLCLPTVAGIVEEERVVGPGILDQPVHCTEDVLLCGLAHGVLLIVGQNDHVFSLVAKLLHQVGRHVSDIVDAASQLATLTKVVDTNQQRFSAASAVGVSESIAWCAVTKALRPIRRGRRITARASLIIAIRGSRTGGRHARTSVVVGLRLLGVVVLLLGRGMLLRMRLLV